MSSGTSSFNGSRLKLKRALSHIEALDRSISEYFATEWHTSSFHQDANGQYHLRVVVRGKPRDLEVIIGDAIHNLRAALDLMAVQLVAASGGNVQQVSFPFCRDASNLEATLKRRNFHRTSVAVQEKIRALKPYGHGNVGLRALHDLDIQDKHRGVIGSLCDITTPPVRVVVDENGIPKGFSQGRPELEVDPTHPPSVVFTFPDYLAGQPIASSLRDLLQVVSDIVDSFEPLAA